MFIHIYINVQTSQQELQNLTQAKSAASDHCADLLDRTLNQHTSHSTTNFLTKRKIVCLQNVLELPGDTCRSSRVLQLIKPRPAVVANSSIVTHNHLVVLDFLRSKCVAVATMLPLLVTQRRNSIDVSVSILKGLVAQCQESTQQLSFVLCIC